MIGGGEGGGGGGGGVVVIEKINAHLIRIDSNDKKFALISRMKKKNALKLMMGGGEGGGGGGGEEIRIIPH